MSLEAMLLGVASAGLLAALGACRESVTVLAVACYTVVLLWLMGHDRALVLPALGIAIVLGVAAVGRRLRHELCDLDTNNHNCHKATKTVTTNPTG